MLKTYLPSEIENLRVMGRTTAKRDPLTLFWTASGIEMLVTGTELYVDMTAGFDTYEPWIEIVIDGVLSQRRMLNQGKQRVCVFRSMEPNLPRRVKLLKATQAFSGDDASFLQIDAIETNGEFLPLPENAMKLEIIGDSITSGESLTNAITETSWNSSIFGAYNGYPVLLAEKLNADLHVISQSGYGIYCSWSGDERESLPQYYKSICGVLHGAHNAELGAFEDWDFASWQPDVIIVNLGTNDSGSFSQTGRPFNGGTGECSMRLESDGSMNKECEERIITAAKDFLRILRENNPQSRILWCLGMLQVRTKDTLRKAVAEYCVETGDNNAEFLPLPETEKDDFGARSHPGVPAHRKAAEILYRIIKG